MIFRKIFKISKATNKKFTEGQIINFIQQDAQQLQMLAGQLTSVLNVPYLTIVVFSVLTYYVQWAVLSAVAAILIIAYLQYQNLTQMSEAQRNLRRAQDGRVNQVCEAMQNIKMLKYNSLTPYFYDRIKEKRDFEIEKQYVKADVRIRQNGIT